MDLLQKNKYILDYDDISREYGLRQLDLLAKKTMLFPNIPKFIVETSYDLIVNCLY